MRRCYIPMYHFLLIPTPSIHTHMYNLRTNHEINGRDDPTKIRRLSWGNLLSTFKNSAYDAAVHSSKPVILPVKSPRVMAPSINSCVTISTKQVSNVMRGTVALGGG
jgi:hypothetical protein